jgi:hypothetical protein
VASAVFDSECKGGEGDVAQGSEEDGLESSDEEPKYTLLGAVSRMIETSLDERMTSMREEMRQEMQEEIKKQVRELYDGVLVVEARGVGRPAKRGKVPPIPCIQCNSGLLQLENEICLVNKAVRTGLPLQPQQLGSPFPTTTSGLHPQHMQVLQGYPLQQNVWNPNVQYYYQ